MFKIKPIFLYNLWVVEGGEVGGWEGGGDVYKRMEQSIYDVIPPLALMTSYDVTDVTDFHLLTRCWIFFS